MKAGLESISQLPVGNVSALTTAESPFKSLFPLNLELIEDPKGLSVFNSIYQAALNCVCTRVCVCHTSFANLKKVWSFLP